MEEPKDRILDSPGEANQDKHINFLAADRGDEDIFENESSSEEEDNDAAEEDNGFFSTDEDDNSSGKPDDKNDLFKTSEAGKDNPAKGLAGTHDLG